MTLEYVTVICADFSNDKVVVLKKLKGPSSVVGRIVFPGGKVEVGESPEDAAVRELLEEAGVKLVKDDLTTIALLHVAPGVHLHVFATGIGVYEASPQASEIEKVYLGSINEYLLDTSGAVMKDLQVCLAIAKNHF